MQTPARSASGSWVELVRVPVVVALLLRLVTLAVVALVPDDLPVEERMASFDAGWYRLIAEGGYPAALPAPGQQTALAFFPAYPLLLRAVTATTGMPTAWAGVLLSVLLSLLATAGVTLVLAHVVGRRAGVGAGVLWSVLPPSCVVGLGYSEALFVTAAAFALLACLEQRWLTAGALTGLACVTRPTGSAVALALGVAVLSEVRAGRAGRPLLGLALAGTPPAAWLLFLEVRTGSALAWFAAQEAGWPGAPLDVARSAGVALLQPGRVVWYTAVAVTLLLAGVLAALLLHRTVRGRVPAPLAAYVLGLLGLVALAGEATYSSAPRVVWTAFPLLLPLAPWLAAGAARAAVAAVVAAAGALVLAVAVVTGSGLVVP